MDEMIGYHSKYFAYLLTLQKSAEDTDRLFQSIFNAQIDINPHQVEAALFAFKSPLFNRVILADEVGLGKTIEAGLVLCQYWSERKKKTAYHRSCQPQKTVECRAQREVFPRLHHHRWQKFQRRAQA